MHVYLKLEGFTFLPEIRVSNKWMDLLIYLSKKERDIYYDRFNNIYVTKSRDIYDIFAYIANNCTIPGYINE